MLLPQLLSARVAVAHHHRSVCISDSFMRCLYIHLETQPARWPQEPVRKEGMWLDTAFLFWDAEAGGDSPTVAVNSVATCAFHLSHCHCKTPSSLVSSLPSAPQGRRGDLQCHLEDSVSKKLQVSSLGQLHECHRATVGNHSTEPLDWGMSLLFQSVL